MDPARRTLWQQADALLDRLLDLPAGERHEALRACAPAPELEAMVLRLLAAHEGGGVLDEGLPASLLPAPPPTDLRGRVLGRWRLQQRIGEGGMAVVYRAVSVEPPLDQAAAVKILALGSLARDAGGEALQREQGLLARLQHPFIAPFHEAGIAADGTPWLAMGLVEGVRIDHWCEHHGADLRTRIRLVLEVADALSYAHRNLVIHRDIKPSNVLVDEDGHVRLLDFGVGHLLGGDGERTATGLRGLTPEYAAPEQLAGGAPGTAMDVYGLGGLLHRLLTGLAPQGAKADAPLHSPSRRVARDAALSPAHRRERVRLLRGDLDTIVMKALAQRPQDRYPSVDALADDLRRWLARRPILARGPDAGYRLRMFVRRNRVAAVAVAAVLSALALGVAGTLWQARQATVQAERARLAAEESRAQLAYLDGILDDLVAPSTTTAHRRDAGELVRVAAARARKELAGREPLLASVESSLASVAERAGHYALAGELADSALQRRERLPGGDPAARALAMIDAARFSRQADPPDPGRAGQLANDALALLRDAAPGSPALVAALAERAIQLGEGDRLDEANALFEEAAAACAGLPDDDPHCDKMQLTHGSLLFRGSRYEDAEAPLRELHEARRRRLGDDHVLTFNVAYLRALNDLRAGRSQAAQPLLQGLLEQQRAAYGQPTRETLLTLQSLAEAAATNSDMALARQLASELLEEALAVTGDSSQELAMAYNHAGNVAFADGDYAAAAAAYGESRRRYGELYGSGSLAHNISTGNYADALRESGEIDVALPLQRRMAAEVERQFPDQPLRIAPRLSNLARTLVKAGRAEQALPLYVRAGAIYREHLPEGPHSDVVASYHAAGLLEAGRIDEARGLARDALQALRARVGDDHRYAWEALATHVSAQCAPPATADCVAAAREARAALLHPALTGHARALLQAALEGRPRR